MEQYVSMLLIASEFVLVLVALPQLTGEQKAVREIDVT